MKEKGDLMEDRMFSRPGETPSPGAHASLVCENHGKTQKQKSLPDGRDCHSLPPGRECQSLPDMRECQSLPSGED